MSEQDMSQRKQRTPQMTELRSLWVDHRCSEPPNANLCSEVVKEICAEFDRAIAAHGAKLREQIVRDLQTKLPKQLADDSENEDGWLSDWDGQVWPAADDTRVDLTGDGSIDLDHIASHAVSIARGKE